MPLWTLGQADIPGRRAPQPRPFIRLGTYSQGGLWITGMIATTRVIPASRGARRLWTARRTAF